MASAPLFPLTPALSLKGEGERQTRSVPSPLWEEVSEKVADLADWIELNLPQVLATRDDRAA